MESTIKISLLLSLVVLNCALIIEPLTEGFKENSKKFADIAIQKAMEYRNKRNILEQVGMDVKNSLEEKIHQYTNLTYIQLFEHSENTNVTEFEVTIL